MSSELKEGHEYTGKFDLTLLAHFWRGKDSRFQWEHRSWIAGSREVRHWLGPRVEVLVICDNIRDFLARAHTHTHTHTKRNCFSFSKNYQDWNFAEIRGLFSLSLTSMACSEQEAYPASGLRNVLQRSYLTVFQTFSTFPFVRFVVGRSQLT